MNRDLNILGNDYKSYFSATVYTGFSYNGNGEYKLDISGLIPPSYWTLNANSLKNDPETNLLISGISNFTNNVNVYGDSYVGGNSTVNTDLIVNGNGRLGNDVIVGKRISAESLSLTANATIKGSVGIGTTNPQGIFHVQQDGNGGLSTIISNSNTGSNAYTVLQFRGGNVGSYLWQNSENRTSDGYWGALNIRNDAQGGNIHLQNRAMYYTSWTSGSEPAFGSNGGGVMIGQKAGLVYPASRLYVNFNCPNGLQSDAAFASDASAGQSLNYMNNFSCLGPASYANNLYFYTKDGGGVKRGVAITLTYYVFTGQHINFYDLSDDETPIRQENIADYIGLIVCSTGKYKYNCQYAGIYPEIREGKEKNSK